MCSPWGSRVGHDVATEQPLQNRPSPPFLASPSLALPFEVSWQDGLQLEQAAAKLCQKPALLVCYCGGYDGYLPHETAGIRYQDLASGFLPQARETIWQSALKCAENTKL